jgi:molybdopterin-guanine dinucleotide biosynthesis adapter protein
MAQDEAGEQAGPRLPHIITVAGLKKSGKTTVTAALIRELRGRGLRVGSVKTIHHHPLALGEAGTDTRRHAEAGAEFTVALLDGELAYFEPRAARPGLAEAARFFAEGIDFIVWEGMSDPGAGHGHVVCLREAGHLDRTLAERRVDPAWIIAVSGVAAGASGADAGRAPTGFPVVDAAAPGGPAALVDLVLAWFREERA